MHDLEELSIEDLEIHIRSASKILEEKKAHYRWEVGFRNIATILIGPKAEFEINDIVEMVRDMKQREDTQPYKAWCECYKKEAWPDECSCNNQ